MTRAPGLAVAAAALVLALPPGTSAAGAAGTAVSVPGTGASPARAGQEASAVSPRSSADRPPDSVPTAATPGPVAPAESVPPGPGPDGAALDQLTAQVAAQLRCPVCRNQSVLESSATLSQEMQREIRRRLAAGDSPAEVKQYFVSRYGEWILLQPPAEGINLLVYILPALALLAGLVLAWRQIRSWAAAGEGDVGAAGGGAVRADGDGEPGAPAGGGDGGDLSREEEERVDALVREG